jgi:hypothetical protein
VKFAQGKVAYERGQYPASARLLEQALNEEGPFTQLGGEIQLWLALAYQVRWGERRQLQQKNAGRASALVPNTPRILCIAAHVQKRLWVPPLRPQRCCFTHLPPFCCVLRQACGREEDCLSVYRNVEKSHPLPAIRRQAADLRYIMEAPRLQINPEERVQIPVLTDLDVNRCGGCAVVWEMRGGGGLHLMRPPHRVGYGLSGDAKFFPAASCSGGRAWLERSGRHERCADAPPGAAADAWPAGATARRCRGRGSHRSAGCPRHGTKVRRRPAPPACLAWASCQPRTLSATSLEPAPRSFAPPPPHTQPHIHTPANAEFWDNYKGPAGLVQNRYVWAAASIAATVAAVYSSYVQRGLLR